MSLEASGLGRAQRLGDRLTDGAGVWVWRRSHQPIPIDDPAAWRDLDPEFGMDLFESGPLSHPDEVSLGEVHHRVVPLEVVGPALRDPDLLDEIAHGRCIEPQNSDISSGK
jgi:hypothetical protein